MLKELCIVLVLLPLAACDSSKLAGNTATSSTETLNEAEYNSSGDAAPQTKDETESPIAFTPVPVAGAYLNCSYVESAPEEIRCVALNDFGVPKEFEAKIAYIISGEGNAWVESSFEETGVGSWIVRKPSSLKPNFAVVLVDASSGVLADWVVDEENLPKMMLVDGGFEDLVVDVTSDETRRATQFLGPESQKTWKARRGANSKCETAYVELNSIKMVSPDPNLFVPHRGDQWTELDSSCSSTGTDSTGGNIALYQDLNLTPGNLYQFSFSYKGKPFVTSLQRLSVKFGDETVFLSDIALGDWVTFKFVRVATQATMRLEFEELGKDDSRGTFLDDVRVFDLGAKKN